jgi:hypothetical protein
MKSAFWKLLMRALEKSSKKAPVKITQDSAHEVVEADEDGMSQAHPSSHASPAHMHTSSQVMSGQACIFVMRRTPVLTICTHSPLNRIILLLHTLPLIFTNVPVHLRPAMRGTCSFHLDITHQQMIPLQPPSEDSFFSLCTGPRPVTVYAARPKKASSGICCHLLAVYITEFLVILDCASHYLACRSECRAREWEQE